MTPGKRLIANLPLTILLATIAALPASNLQASITYRTVVISGDSIPGEQEGVVFEDPGHVIINASGDTAFVSSLNSTDPSNPVSGVGIWAEANNFLRSVIRTGDAAPGTEPGIVFRNFTDLRYNSAGQTSFRGALTGEGIVSSWLGTWSEGAGPLRKVMRIGDPAPGTEPDTSYNIGWPALSFNDAGQTLYTFDTTAQSTSHEGIWIDTPGTVELVVRGGDEAPGTEPGTVFHNFQPPLINASGQIAFQNRLFGPAIDSSNFDSLWSGDIDDLSIVARTGDPALNTEAGTVFSSFDLHSLNAAGQTAFYASTNSAISGSGGGLWSEGGGNLHLVALRGEQAPDTDPGVIFTATDSIILNASGHALFSGRLAGPGVNNTNLDGRWIEKSGSSSLIVRTGDPAPGLGDGVVFSGLGSTLLNDTDQVVFLASLNGTGVNESNNDSLWVTDLHGDLLQVARTGDLFDVDPDPIIEDLRAIESIMVSSISARAGNGANSFNNAGQIGFSLTFTDGTSGIFVANTRLPGDLNGDGFVGLDDLTTVLSNWNQNVTPWDILSGDPSGDGFVGIDDLNTVLPNWNDGTPPIAHTASNQGSNTPEPGSLLILTGLLGLLNRRV